MEQTRLQNFFSARKRSTVEGHPSKRRKLDQVSPRKECQNRQTVQSTKCEVVSLSRPDHDLCMRKTNSQLVRKQIEDSLLTTPNLAPVASPSRSVQSPLKVSNSTTTPDLTSQDSSLVPRSPMKLNHWVNEQAKNVLHSRGAMMINESLKRGSSASSASAGDAHCTQPSQLKTPEKSLPGGTEGSLDTIIPKSPQNTAKNSRGLLRAKFAHLVESTDLQVSLVPTSVSLPLETASLRREEEEIKLSKPLHEKFKHLTTPAVPSSSLTLPQKYRILLETFRCADSVMYLLNQRSEICTFDRLKQSVQQMSGRSFELKHLGMLKTVYPSAFTFRQEKGLHSISGDKSTAYQLTIEANFRECLIGKATSVTPTVLITRRLAFESNLLAITMQHHQKFIRKLNINLPDAEIRRWHPHFKIEEVPEIDPSSLPETPVVGNYTSAAEFLHKSKGNLAPKVIDAFTSVVNQTGESSRQQGQSERVVLQAPVSSGADERREEPVLTSSSSSQNVKLRGVSQSLLDRIRLKEQKKIELTMTRDPAKERRLSTMNRLPDMARIIKTFFTTEKKSAVALDDCLQKLQESYGSAVSIADLQEHINLLVELVPQWIAVAAVRKTSYVKLTKDFDINKVLSMLTERRQKEESTS